MFLLPAGVQFWRLEFVLVHLFNLPTTPLNLELVCLLFIFWWWDKFKALRYDYIVVVLPHGQKNYPVRLYRRITDRGCKIHMYTT